MWIWASAEVAGGALLARRLPRRPRLVMLAGQLAVLVTDQPWARLRYASAAAVPGGVPLERAGVRAPRRRHAAADAAR
ncbi:hypothetical protein CLM82_26290 [Streptomyces albidoflavus]|nr:hypothetical protein CLM82_26290 [Streptomyces albidoflavus]